MKDIAPTERDELSTDGGVDDHEQFLDGVTG